MEQQAGPDNNPGSNPEPNQQVGPETDLEQAWWSVVEELQPNQRAWLEASAPVTLHGNQAIIEVADEFTRSQLEGRLRAQIEECLTAVFGREIRLGVTVNPALVADRAARVRRSPRVDQATRRLSHMSTCRPMGSACRPAHRPPARASGSRWAKPHRPATWPGREARA